ncbi:MAG: hypothetical protein ACRYF3_06200 [Janthinobacterium lividum]
MSPTPLPTACAETVLEAAAAVAAEDEDRAGVAMFLTLRPQPGPTATPAVQADSSEADTSAADPPAVDFSDLAARLARVWEVLADADPDVTVQDALAVLADLELRPTPAPAPAVRPDRLAAWRPAGWTVPPRAERDAEAAEVRDALAGGRLLRVVNYHDTPVSRRAEFRGELQWYAERFDPVTAADVLEFQVSGRWRSERPGILPAFYDGFASAVRVVEPLLAETGLVGWFYPPTAFLDVPAEQQRTFATAHHYGVLEHPEGRLAMTWDDLARLAETHEVCGHTATHAASREVRDAGDVETQVLRPIARLSEVCGRPPAAWAWLGGTPFDPLAPGDQAVRACGVPLFTSNASMQGLGSAPW